MHVKRNETYQTVIPRILAYAIQVHRLIIIRYKHCKNYTNTLVKRIYAKICRPIKEVQNIHGKRCIKDV